MNILALVMTAALFTLALITLLLLPEAELLHFWDIVLPVVKHDWPHPVG